MVGYVPNMIKVGIEHFIEHSIELLVNIMHLICYIIGAPEIEIPDEYREVVKHKAGTTVELRFGIIAKPAPTIEWYKDRKELESGAQAQLVQKNAADSSTLIIRDTTRLNSGTYEMRLKNSLGSAYAYVRVQILGTYCSLSFLFWYLYGTYMSTLLAQYRKSYGKLLMESYSIVNSQYSIVTQYL